MKPPGIFSRGTLPRVDRGILAPAAAYLALILVFDLTEADLWVQDHFFNFQTGRWLVDGRAPVPKWIFYTGPKLLLGIYGLVLLLIAVKARPGEGAGPGEGTGPTGPGGVLARIAGKVGSRKALYLLVCLGLVPSLIGLGKSLSGICCPSEIARYGGPYPYRNFIESVLHRGPGHCYPAGHASGGFALLSLGFAGRRRNLWIGLAAGWIMGIYQMLKGAHYLSHTLATMILAWIIVAAAARLFHLRSPATGP